MTTYLTGHLLDLQNDDRLAFQYVPRNIRSGGQAEWSQNTVIGESHPRQQFIGSGGQVVGFSLAFHWETDDTSEVFKKARWCESLRFPHVNGTGETKSAPPTVALVMGRLWLGSVFRVDRVETDYAMDFHDPDTLYPLVARVNMELVELSDRSVDFRVVRYGGADDVGPNLGQVASPRSNRGRRVIPIQ